MPGEAEDPRLILLDGRDNVLVVRQRVRAGEVLTIEGQALRAAIDLPLAHKVARRPIGAGERILKYGAPIGSATADIAAGEHVHVHNVRSEYTPTYVIPGASEGAS